MADGFQLVKGTWYMEATKGIVDGVDIKQRDNVKKFVQFYNVRAIILLVDLISIGRDPTLNVILDDLLVSRKHAALLKKLNGWSIMDLGSSNGTTIMRANLPIRLVRNKETRLEKEDLILMGSTILRFV